MGSFTEWLFVPNGDNRRETATLLVGTATEYGIDTRLIRPVGSGFYVSPEVEEALRSEGVDLPQPGADRDGFGGDAPEPEPEPEDDEPEDDEPEDDEDDEDDEDEDDEDDEPEPEPEDAYDPADYKVKQVKEFVQSNPEIASDVLAAEQAGENRSTLVEWLTNHINDASSDPAGE